ncbi:uncharacterized protein LOC116012143 [Ipomoea triloba]|uniref:uncharacterized protein LOC116012143 n=1 Tax=Ipomoea triloba TaxID=35885 RepID=UPI00125D1C40|nr:uncharacterized protein LOC116012143 [Ipomoea triloba]
MVYLDFISGRRMGTNLYFRGERVFNAVMQELLQIKRGWEWPKISAGGIATTLHCDAFRELIPNACRVKCLSDAAYFFPSRRFKDCGDLFIPLLPRINRTTWISEFITKIMHIKIIYVPIRVFSPKMCNKTSKRLSFS